MKYVCLDIGNVLYHCDFKTFLNKLSHALNITLEDAQYFLNRTQKLHDLGYTVMSDELRDHFKIKSQVIIDDLLKYWVKSIKPDMDILIQLDHLSKQNELKISLLSNIGIEHAQIVNQTLTNHNLLHNCIKHFSCEVGARKPTSLFYQSFLLQYPEFKNCLYIDDIQDNLETGKKFGLNPFHFSLLDHDKSLLLMKITSLILKS